MRNVCVCVCVCYYIAFAFAITPCYFVIFYTDFFVAAAARTRHRLDVKICQKTAQNLRSFWFVCVHDVVCVCACERASKLMLVAVVVVVVFVLID